MRPVREENEKRLQAAAESTGRRWIGRLKQGRRRARSGARSRPRSGSGRTQPDKRQEEINQRQQDRARAAKDALGPALERLSGLPDSASVWRRKTLAETRASLEQTILELCRLTSSPRSFHRARDQTVGPACCLGPKDTPGPSRADGLRRLRLAPSWRRRAAPGVQCEHDAVQGELVIVEIADMPYGKPIVLKLVSR